MKPYPRLALAASEKGSDSFYDSKHFKFLQKVGEEGGIALDLPGFSDLFFFS